MKNFQIIVFEPNAKILDLFNLNISHRLYLEVIPCLKIQEAFAFLKGAPATVLFITRSLEGNEAPLREIINAVKKFGPKTKLILYGKQFVTEDPMVKVVLEQENRFDLENLMAIIRDELKLKSEDLAPLAGTQYFPVQLDFFKYFPTALVDIYVQLGKGEESVRHVKLLQRDHAINRDVLEKFKQKGLRTFYIPIDDLQNFTQALNKQLSDSLNEKKEGSTSAHELSKLAPVAVLEGTTVIQEGAAKALTEIGLKVEEVHQAQAAIHLVISSLEKSSSIIGALSKIIKQEGSYSFKHSYMVGIISYNVLKQFTWANAKQFESLIYTCFFHDLLLESEDSLKIESQEQFDKAKLSDKEKVKVMNHALVACAYIQKQPQFPLNADLIIKHHHGSETGIGFPREISGRIHRIAVIFLVCEIFVLEVLKSNGTIAVADALNKVKARFTGPHIPSTIGALKKVLSA